MVGPPPTALPPGRATRLTRATRAGHDGSGRSRRLRPVTTTPAGRDDPGRYDFLAAFAAAFISCLCARTLVSDSGPVMSATDRKDFGSP